MDIVDIMIQIIIYIVFYLVYVAPPVILAIINTINLFRAKPKNADKTDKQTMILGILYPAILYYWSGAKDYQEPVILGGGDFGLHTPIASWHLPTILGLAFVGLIGYFLLRVHGKELSPIFTVICLSCVYIGIAISVIYFIQLSKNFFELGAYSFNFVKRVLYAALFPLNYTLCSIRLIKNIIKYQIANNDQEYESPILNRSKNLLLHSVAWLIIPFILMLPLLGILIAILVLFGQKPDAVIKAFTETSDWTLSQQVSPPPIDYHGHYLCTVALKGDERLVKPTRCGVRYGVKIIVNRQLCVANAFEQCIQERLPKLHRLIRRIYDKYGYPLSKHITTKERANIVYILMKPLEWLFVLFLYTVDKNPENRIAMQYTKK